MIHLAAMVGGLFKNMKYKVLRGRGERGEGETEERGETQERGETEERERERKEGGRGGGRERRREGWAHTQ